MVEYTQNTKKLGTKKVDCPNCSAHLYAESDGNESVLRVRVPRPEFLTCPACGRTETHDIDPLQGTMQEYECKSCHSILRAVRSRKGVSVRNLNAEALKPHSDAFSSAESDYNPAYGQRHDLPEELLSRITELMGQQPWPQGKSHEVRLALNISRYTIDYAIKQLISRGVFKPQVNGVLYDPIDALK
jgi:Zn finger protein HypA/HybF involved in hydrogenase expression